MGERAHHRIGREAAQRAERTELHRVAEVFEHGEVLRRSSRCAMMRSMISTPRVEPMRQGVHLPQDSIAQNSIANRACFGHVDAVVEHHDAAMADQAVARGKGFVVERRVEQRAGSKRRAARRPARPAPAGRVTVPPPMSSTSSPSVTPKAISNRPPCSDIAGELDRHRAARAAHAEIADRTPRPCPAIDRHRWRATARC